MIWVAGSVIVAAWLVARAVHALREELVRLRLLGEHVAQRSGIDLEDYVEQVTTLNTGLPSMESHRDGHVPD